MTTDPVGGWKNIWYYFNGTAPPDILAYAIEISQEQTDSDAMQIKVKDLTLM
jgi:hypothetical protein